MEVVHNYNKTHSLVKIKIRDLLELPIRNWSRNRPPDLDRCKEIADYIYQKRPVLDWFFYMIQDSAIYEIIDGIHRFTAIQMVHKYICDLASSKRELDNPIEINIDNFHTQFYEQSIFISVRWNASLGETIDVFQNINKCVPIADLYIHIIENFDKRKILEEIYHTWKYRYPSHFTHSAKPQTPNTNRDRFIDMIESIYDKEPTINSSIKDKIEEHLFRMNEWMKHNISPKTSDKVLQKCNKTGCFLFSGSFSKDLY